MIAKNKNNNGTPLNFAPLFYLPAPLYQNSIYSAFIRKGTAPYHLYVRHGRGKGWVLNARTKSKSVSRTVSLGIRRDRKSTARPTYTRRRRIKCPIHFIWSTRMAPSARWRRVFRPKRARTEERGERRRGGFRTENAAVLDRTEDLARSESAADWIVFRGTPTVSLILLLRARKRETRARLRRETFSRHDLVCLDSDNTKIPSKHDLGEFPHFVI